MKPKILLKRIKNVRLGEAMAAKAGPEGTITTRIEPSFFVGIAFGERFKVVASFKLANQFTQRVAQFQSRALYLSLSGSPHYLSIAEIKRFVLSIDQTVVYQFREGSPVDGTAHLVVELLKPFPEEL